MRIGLYLACLAISVTALTSNSWNDHDEAPAQGGLTTDEYIANLDISAFERQGSGFANQKFSPLRIGKPMEQIDNVYDYDFERLRRVERRLAKVDRRKALKAIFHKVTADVNSHHEKHLEKHFAILEFLQKGSFHNAFVQPVYPNRQLVTDPLVLLELGEMRRGHVARVAVHLFEAAGYPARLVQLGGHVIAEVYYDGDWHYFDADVFANGEVVTQENGTVPSIRELSRDPFAIDALAHYRELPYGARMQTDSIRYPSHVFFSKHAYGPGKGSPALYQKTANESESQDRFFGWKHYEVIGDSRRALHSFPPFFQPSAVSFTRIEVGHSSEEKRAVLIEWTEAKDQDSDFLGYRIFISRQSRGWAYGEYKGPAHLKNFIASIGWSSDMYEALLDFPPHEVDRIESMEPALELSLPEGRIYYITVMPYDAHGDAVGKVLYHMSHEIMINT